MGWSIGFDDNWKRDIGYGVPATCDHPECEKEIHRGLSYVCGHGQPYGGDSGCGLYFCPEHGGGGLCERCEAGQEPFDAKPDTAEWMQWKLQDESWQGWRDEHPEEVLRMRAALEGKG